MIILNLPRWELSWFFLSRLIFFLFIFLILATVLIGFLLIFEAIPAAIAAAAITSTVRGPLSFKQLLGPGPLTDRPACPAMAVRRQLTLEPVVVQPIATAFANSIGLPLRHASRRGVMIVEQVVRS